MVFNEEKCLERQKIERVVYFYKYRSKIEGFILMRRKGFFRRLGMIFLLL